MAISALVRSGGVHTGAVRSFSKRDTILLLGFVVLVTALVMTFVVGPRYLEPLPLPSKLAIVALGCAFIGVAAYYSRRRARRV
jgi:hypothetical protein